MGWRRRRSVEAVSEESLSWCLCGGCGRLSRVIWFGAALYGIIWDWAAVFGRNLDFEVVPRRGRSRSLRRGISSDF